MALLADSQLLLSPGKGDMLRAWMNKHLDQRCLSNRPKRAVYIGASNGDLPEFYQMAIEICAAWNINQVIHVQCVADLVALHPQDVDVVLLAGGDVTLGWSFLSQLPIKQWLNDYSADNGVFVGVSAGAIHLSNAYISEHSVAFLGYHAACIVAHEEREGWPTARAWQAWASREPQQVKKQGQLPLIGLPFGGGLLVDSEATLPVGNGIEVFQLERER
ncbi:MAG: hypothetical protein COA99_00805 [Moraxellaceae bacterium]|nr:MAG: hypothetical protein COA99_00805 [Moraxellaceae bacterium]